MQGIIFDIKHYAIHDGPGIRQTVFFKGCPLACWWCHNPESRGSEVFSYQKTENCSGTMLTETQTVGQAYSVKELMKEIEKDQLIFDESGGGITISGGEPLMQFDFLMALLKACKQKDIHTCIDTTAYTDWEKLEQLLPFTDLFLIDLKHIDPQQHLKYTGVSNTRILRNIRLLAEAKKDIWFRYPLIPGLNDDEGDLLRMLAFLKELKTKHPISILPYHKIGRHKYSRFGIDYKMNGVNEPTQAQLNKVRQYFQHAGFEASIGG